MSTIAAVVVTYHPGAVVLENIRILSRQVGRIIVVDNGSSGASVEVIDALQKISGVQLLRNASNLGIAAALNIGIREALLTGPEWIATFDQDSSVTENYFQDLFYAYEMCPEAKFVGMLVPRGWSATLAKVMQIGTPVWAFVMGGNSSGSLIKSEVIRLIGLYDADLFIDFVDMDYCLRMKRKGFKVLKAMRVVLHHELGSKQTRNLLGLKISFRDHTPWRYYYIMRNRLLLYQRFFPVAPLWICADTAWFFYGLAQLCIENDRVKKIHAMWDGFKDAMRGRVGRHPEYPPPIQ
jgi:rhamnosyltransferase